MGVHEKSIKRISPLSVTFGFTFKYFYNLLARYSVLMPLPLHVLYSVYILLEA